MISWRNLWGQHLQTDFRAGAGPGRTAERDCVKWLSLFVQRVGAVILQDRCPANGTRPQQVFSLTKVMFTSMAGRRHWQRPLCPSSLVCLFATDTSSKKHSFLSFQSFRALVGAAETNKKTAVESEGSQLQRPEEQQRFAKTCRRLINVRSRLLLIFDFRSALLFPINVSNR